MSWVTCPCASIILSRSFWWLGPRAGSLGAPCLRSQVLGLAWGCSSPGQGWGRGCLPSLWSASCAQSPSRRKQVLTSLDSQVGCERCTCPCSFCSARLDSWQESLLTEVPPEVEEETVMESWLRVWYPQLPETHTKCFLGLQNTFYFLYRTSCSEGFQNRHWGPFFLMFIYLFGCTRSSLRHAGSSVVVYELSLWHVGSSSLTRDRTCNPCVGSIES